jgi:hypothetical protein
MGNDNGECKGARDGMTGEDFEVLAEHRQDRAGLRVKSDRVGFSAAHRVAREYCAHVKAHLSRVMRGDIGETDDASRAAGPGRKRDLESTFLSFPVRLGGRHINDTAMTRQFRVALLRADQQWDQIQARSHALHRDMRRAAFQQRLATVLAGEAYQHVDAVTKERLLADVTGIVFPAAGRGL